MKFETSAIRLSASDLSRLRARNTCPRVNINAGADDGRARRRLGHADASLGGGMKRGLLCSPDFSLCSPGSTSHRGEFTPVKVTVSDRMPSRKKWCSNALVTARNGHVSIGASVEHGSPRKSSSDPRGCLLVPSVPVVQFCLCRKCGQCLGCAPRATLVDAVPVKCAPHRRRVNAIVIPITMSTADRESEPSLALSN